MEDDWVIQGSRPPSVADSRPRSAASKNFHYHTVRPDSAVDETLFTSNYKGRMADTVNFQPPWDSTKKFNSKKIIVKKIKRDRPLLWSPAPNTSCENFAILKKGAGLRSEKFRPIKHTESFCDETLFGGNQFEDQGFEAPWNCRIKSDAIYRDLNGNPVANINSTKNWKNINLRIRPTSAFSKKGPTKALWKP